MKTDTQELKARPVRNNGLAGISMLLWLVAALFAYITMTAPIIATAGPAIITVASAAGGWFLWRRSAAPPQ
jgi:hypothetical protein